MTSRNRISSAALGGALVLAAAACLPRPDETPLEPMGRLPGLVTTAEPEWIPFQVAAGAELPRDPREERLSEPRAVPVGGQARRLAWSPDARSLLVEVKRDDAACEEAWEIPLDRRSPRRVSGAGQRARIGAFVEPGKAIIAESPCSEPAASASWSILQVEVASNKRRTLAHPDGEAIGATSDGTFAYFATRGSGAKKDRLERVALGGGAPLLVVDCNGLDSSTVARTRVVYGCKASDGTAQLLSASDEGGMQGSWSGGRQIDVDASLDPAGRLLAFASTRVRARTAGSKPAEGPFQIFFAPFEDREMTGGEPQRLTFAGSNNRAPAFGPDGRIAYLSDRGAPGGPLGVVVARFEAP